jgi:hypothetical protein
MKDLTITTVTVRGQIGDKEFDDLEWHVQHGAVYALWLGGDHIGTVWLSFMPEDMVMLCYEYHARKGVRFNMVKCAKYVLKWLFFHYPVILGTIDECNEKSRRFARLTGWKEVTTITTKEGRRKILLTVSIK